MNEICGGYWVSAIKPVSSSCLSVGVGLYSGIARLVRNKVGHL
jgi:hypothetical protein